MNDGFVPGLILGIVIGAAAGVVVIGSAVSQHWTREAIAHGAGEYHPKTSEFRWILPKLREDEL